MMNKRHTLSHGLCESQALTGSAFQGYHVSFRLLSLCMSFTRGELFKRRYLLQKKKPKNTCHCEK